MGGYLKRLAAPKTWPIQRKEKAWVTKPLPCGHKLDFCMPISVILNEVLKITKTNAEVKKLLANKEIFIDNRRVKDYKEGVGLFDVLSFPQINKYYTLIISEKNKLKLIEISKEEAQFKPLKIIRKNVIKGGRIQVTCHDGRTILFDKSKVNDTLIFNLKDKKIVKHLPLTNNSLVYIIKGNHVGKIGKSMGEVRHGLKKFGVIKFDKQTGEVLIENLFVIDEKIANLIEKGGNEK
ncbi:MAG: hypothetical protein QW244_00080 [Candidatus Pacearchaeota archaeon]